MLKQTLIVGMGMIVPTTDEEAAVTNTATNMEPTKSETTKMKTFKVNLPIKLKPDKTEAT